MRRVVARGDYQLLWEDRANFYPNKISGGQQQRVAIARALANDPPILVADEPTGNLDQTTAWEVMNILLDINKQGTTVLVATHNQEILSALKYRVIELQEGRVVSDTKKPEKVKKSAKKKSVIKETKPDNKEDLVAAKPEK